MTEQRRPDWESQRSSAPERPAVPTGIVQESRIDRPGRTTIALTLTLVGALCFIGVLTSAVLHLEEIRASFIQVLNDALEEDYAEADKERAVNIMLGIIGGVALLIAFALALAANSVRSQRNSVARIIMIILLVLFVPAAFLAATLRENNWLELLLSGVAMLCFLSALVLYFTPRVSQWLHQSDKRPPTPLSSLAHGTAPKREE